VITFASAVYEGTFAVRQLDNKMSYPSRTFLQGNLKAFTGVSHPTPDLIDELALAICEHHTALEHLCLQQQFNAWSVITSAILQQPHAQSLRAFPVSTVDMPCLPV
jgi:hypothetical protein